MTPVGLNSQHQKHLKDSLFGVSVEKNKIAQKCRLYWFEILGVSIILMLTSCLSYSADLVRGPYLQMGGPDTMTIRWRTDIATESVVRFGFHPKNLSQTVRSDGDTVDHIVTLNDLAPYKTYFYSVGTETTILAGAEEGYRFKTSPMPGSATPTRIWMIGDSGTADANAKAVYDAYMAYPRAANTDLWVMLGDNAYNSGRDEEYQRAVFDMYPELLARTPLWSTLGNHDGYSANAGTQSGPYFDIFSFPTNGEIGGLASGTEAYYSFDYGNIHFICLDSYQSARNVDGAMLSWVRNDIAATDKQWIIAFWHHPPYTKGSHDSDLETELIDMRVNALPILESYGVDLVFSGHSHSYERSFLIDGHYGGSDSFMVDHKVGAGSGREDDTGAYTKSRDETNNGAVYTVAGASGKISGGALNHPAMYLSLNQLGSIVLDVNNERLDVKYLNAEGVIADYFTLLKEGRSDRDAKHGLNKDDSSVDGPHKKMNRHKYKRNTQAYTEMRRQPPKENSQLKNQHQIAKYNSSRYESVRYKNSKHQVSKRRELNLKKGMDSNMSKGGRAEVANHWRYVTHFQEGVAPAEGYSGAFDITLGGEAKYVSSANQLIVGEGITNKSMAFIQWDISAIPVNAVIQSVVLEFNVINKSSAPLSLYAGGMPWSDDDLFSDALLSSLKTAEAVGEFTPEHKGRFALTLNNNGVAMVQRWLEGSNFGLVLLQAEGAGAEAIIASSEALHISKRPRLTVRFTQTLD